MNNGFHFGLETEYLIFKNSEDSPALWADELKFSQIYGILKNIPFKDIANMQGIDAEDAHEEISPYIVEGYHLKNSDGSPSVDMLVKGVEIRTPVCDSIENCLKIYEILLSRLKLAMEENGFYLSALSHHPTATKFEADRMGRRHDFWNWAKVAMKTYGPDINISYPKNIEERIFQDLNRFHQRVNYYTPALSALTLSSPFFNGQLDMRQENIILSHRTLRRSPVAPAIEPHLNENGRMEFKFFEMANTTIEYHGMFLLCLILSLANENELTGLSEDHDRIYGLGEVAKKGLLAANIFEIIGEIRSCSDHVLSRFGFDSSPLEVFWSRLDKGVLPGHELINLYQTNHSMLEILKYRIPIISNQYV